MFKDIRLVANFASVDGIFRVLLYLSGISARYLAKRLVKQTPEQQRLVQCLVDFEAVFRPFGVTAQHTPQDLKESILVLLHRAWNRKCMYQLPTH